MQDNADVLRKNQRLQLHLCWIETVFSMFQDSFHEFLFQFFKRDSFKRITPGFKTYVTGTLKVKDIAKDKKGTDDFGTAIYKNSIFLCQ